MKFIQNYHNEHTKFKFSMLIVIILYDLHTSHFAVYCRLVSIDFSLAAVICNYCSVASHKVSYILSFYAGMKCELPSCVGGSHAHAVMYG